MCHTPGYHSQNWNDDCPSLKIKGVPQKWSANYTHGCNSWTPGSCLINIVCTYWLSVKAGKGNIWLEVMTYEPRSVTSQHFLWQVDCVSIEYYQIERTTKPNASANWMAHQTEWLTFKLNDSSSNGPPNWMAHYWMIHFHYRVTHRALNAGPNARSLVYTRRQSIADEIFFLKFGGVTVFRVFPCFVYPRTQNSCVFGFPSGTGASNMASSFELVVGQK